MTIKEINEYEHRLFNVYSGILFNYQEFAPSGKEVEITYDFNCPEYKTLIEKYSIDKIAGKGTAFQRAKRLMHWMAPKLTHKSNYDNHVPCNALDLLEYSLNQPDHGINCLNKAKILTECCLAMGIYARRVLILPYSPYDGDSHVVTEIYDDQEGKWIMLDPTVDGYFVGEDRTPLSVLELRDKLAHQHFATCVKAAARHTELLDPYTWPRTWFYAWVQTYFCKNLFYLKADVYNGFGGERNNIWFLPAGYDLRKNEFAHADYCHILYPDEEGFWEKRREELKTKPAPVPSDISLLTAPPQ